MRSCGWCALRFYPRVYRNTPITIFAAGAIEIHGGHSGTGWLSELEVVIVLGVGNGGDEEKSGR